MVCCRIRNKRNLPDYLSVRSVGLSAVVHVINREFTGIVLGGIAREGVRGTYLSDVYCQLDDVGIKTEPLPAGLVVVAVVVVIER